MDQDPTLTPAAPAIPTPEDEKALLAKVIEDGLAAAVSKLQTPKEVPQVVIQAFEDDLKPYWKSTTIVASGVGLFGFVAGLLGHSLLPSDLQLISDTITGSITVAGYIGAIIGRLKASKVLH